MSNSEIDLDTLTIAGRNLEIFDPDSKSAWSGASSRIYVSTHRSGPASVFQIGYDPELDKTFVRSSTGGPESRWSNWLAVEAPPPPPPESDTRSKAKARDEDEEEETTTTSRNPRKK